MVWTVEELDALKSAYAQGALNVRWGDRSVTYGSREDLRRRIEELEQELGITPKGHRRRIAVIDQGLD